MARVTGLPLQPFNTTLQLELSKAGRPSNMSISVRNLYMFFGQLGNSSYFETILQNLNNLLICIDYFTKHK